MSRSGYTEDGDDQWGLIRYRGAVASAIRGKYGQAFLSELIQSMDALPEPKLISNELEKDGCYCALGTVAAQRGLDMTNVDPYDTETVGNMFNIADSLAREIMWVNDEGTCAPETPEQRFVRVRKWAVSNLTAPQAA